MGVAAIGRAIGEHSTLKRLELRNASIMASGFASLASGMRVWVNMWFDVMYC